MRPMLTDIFLMRLVMDKELSDREIREAVTYWLEEKWEKALAYLEKDPPPFGAKEILEEMRNGSRFAPFTFADTMVYLDAPHGSIICNDWDGWTVIISPDGHLEVQAYWYSPDGDAPQTAYQLSPNGWAKI